MSFLIIKYYLKTAEFLIQCITKLDDGSYVCSLTKRFKPKITNIVKYKYFEVNLQSEI